MIKPLLLSLLPISFMIGSTNAYADYIDDINGDAANLLI